MAFTLRWKNPGAAGNYAASKADIEVPVGTIVADKASVKFTGKGAGNYAAIQQENLMRLLENSADTVPPAHPTIGETWYDSTAGVMKLCTAVVGNVGTWKTLSGVQTTNVGDPAPSPATLGDLWFQRTGTVTGILYVYTGLGRFPTSVTTNGGWNQIWPAVEVVAGREEYELVRGLLFELIRLEDGGNGAYGKYITDVVDFADLDADLKTKYAAAGTDINFLAGLGGTPEVKVEPTSQDWDTLLAAAKYAVNRLELPTGIVNDISPVPFVHDGRQAPTSLLGLNTADVRYPTLERRTNKRYGLVSLLQYFTETVNVLQAAKTNRYALKGINGGSGSNPAFDGIVSTTNFVFFGGNAAGNTNGTITLRLNFSSINAKTSFLNSGGAVQLALSSVLAATSTSGDFNMQALINARSTIRLTADKIRIFSGSPMSLVAQPIDGGLREAGGTLTTQTLNGASYTISATEYDTAIDLTFAFVAGAMNSFVGIQYSIIRDTTTYAAPVILPVFDKPLDFNSADKSGSAWLVRNGVPTSVGVASAATFVGSTAAESFTVGTNYSFGPGYEGTDESDNELARVEGGSPGGSVTSVTLQSGQLPPGMSLSVVPLYSNGAAWLGGTPTAAGTYSFTVAVTWDKGGSFGTATTTVMKTITIAVTQTATTHGVLVPMNYVTGTVGVAYNTTMTGVQQVHAFATAEEPWSGPFPGPQLGSPMLLQMISATGLPPGTNVGTSGGAVIMTGTPTTAGTYNVNYQYQYYDNWSNVLTRSGSSTIVIEQLMTTVGTVSSATYNGGVGQAFGLFNSDFVLMTQIPYSGSTANPNYNPTVTSVTGSGLPPGVSIAYTNSAWRLVGTPTASGPYTAQITLSGVDSWNNNYVRTQDLSIFIYP